MNDKERPMPPLIAFAGALGGLAVVRWAYRTALRVNRELEEARLARLAEADRLGEIPTLRRDPIPVALIPRLLADTVPRACRPLANPESDDGLHTRPHAPGTLVPGLHSRPAAVLG